MNVVREILREHSKANTDKIVAFVGNDPGRFKELVLAFLAGPYRVTQRASWPLSNCVEQYPNLVRPHLNAILKAAQTQGMHDAVKRSVIRLLQFIDIPSAYQGRVAAFCFDCLADPKEPIAARVFSMTVISNLAHSLPDLQRELRLIIEDQLPYASPAFRSRAKLVLNGLKRLQ